MAAYDYPIYGTQWHPEKNAFEWTRPYIPHSPSAIKTTFYLAQFFVSEGMSILSFWFLNDIVSSCIMLILFSLPIARKNFHKFESEDEESNALIYNYNPVFTGPKSGFEQIYFF